MSIKDWSFGRKLMLFVGVLLTIDMAGLAVIIVVSRTPGNPLSKVFESMRDRGEKDDPDAETIIAESSEILKHDKDNIKALERRADAYYDSDENKLALADFEHLIRLQPKEPKWIKGKASVIRWDDPAAASKDFSKVIAMEGPNFDNLTDRAACYRDLNNNALGLKDLNATLSMKLNCDQLYLRAKLFKSFDCDDQYLVDLKTALDTAGGSDYGRRRALDDLYTYYVRREQNQLALGCINRFIVRVSVQKNGAKYEYGDGLHYGDLTKLADLNLVLGNSEEALKNYVQALKLVEANIAKAEPAQGEYYSLDFLDLSSAVKLARLINDQNQIAKVDKDVTERALAQLKPGKRIWYGGLVDLLETLPPEYREKLGQATLKYLDQVHGDDQYARFDRIKVLILLEHRAEARAALDKLAPDSERAYERIKPYLMLGDHKKVLQCVEAGKPETGSYHDFVRLKVLYCTGDLSGSQKLAKTLISAKSIRPDDYLLLSQVAKANHDLAESKRLKKIAAALGQFDALMDIRNGKL